MKASDMEWIQHGLWLCIERGIDARVFVIIIAGRGIYMIHGIGLEIKHLKYFMVFSFRDLQMIYFASSRVPNSVIPK